VAHDFNNLLQVINGYAAMLADDLEHGRGDPAHAEEIRLAGQRAGTLVRQLLAFGRRQVLHRRALDLNLTVGHLLPMLESLLGDIIAVEFHDDPHLGRVDADAGQIEQALVNLCLNAREAMGEGGSVEIATADVTLGADDCAELPGTRPGRYARLSVTDTGRGMPPKVAARALEPFFTTKGVGEGSGLGLATVYGIVQQHEGGLNLQSEPGRGTRVAIYLPVTATEAGTGPGAGPVTGRPGAVRATILVAEDDPAVLHLTRQLLEKDGYRVLTARDGKEALALFARHGDDVSLAVLDVVMPGGGGRSVHDAIRREAPALPIVFCTGHDLAALHPDLRLDERTVVLQKAFTPGDLLATIRRMLGTGHQHGPPPGAT
jgi:CheY-like chemotaxis protein